VRATGDASQAAGCDGGARGFEPRGAMMHEDMMTHAHTTWTTAQAIYRLGFFTKKNNVI